MQRRFRVRVEGKLFEVEVEEIKEDVRQVQQQEIIERNLTSEVDTVKQTSLSTESSKVIVKAPLPGRILKIRTQKGQSIKKGEAIILIEAMKMESEILVPRDGIVFELLVSEGKVVNTGDSLVILE